MSKERVAIIEVGPRDGLQNEPITVPTEVKLAFIKHLVDAGLKEIEATSFVSPKQIPQLADADALWPQLPVGPAYSALVANEKGLERALAVGVKRIAVFTAASSPFTERNIGMTIDESLVRFRSIISQFRANGGQFVRGYISTAFECPYAGKIEPKSVIRVASELFSMGVDEISLGDTIGTAVPVETKALLRDITGQFHPSKIACHFHDTNGTAIANVSESLNFGIRRFDSSAAGLGGCPYAPGAGGNLASDDLVYFLERSGFETGVNQSALAQASLQLLSVLEKSVAAHAQLSALSRVSKTQS